MNSITSFAAKAFINKYIEKYGKVQELKIDSKKKNIDLVVSLKGEIEPLSINIQNYKFFEENNKTFIILNQIYFSREWMNLSAEDYVIGKKFEIPPKISGIVKTIL